MSRLPALKVLACTLVAGYLCETASAADANACTQFKWDVSRELALMKQPAQTITAAVKPGAQVPQLKIGTLYSLKLADEARVTFAAAPAKASAAASGAQAGLVQFRVKQAGRYRVSITSGHWVDIVDGVQLLKSVDYQGHVDCERPRKIVAFDLPAGHTLTLQFSGASDSEVTMAITAAGTD
jgi:hypothetical protein